MADATTVKYTYNGNKRGSVTLTNICDGTGESGVVKIDKSTLVGLTGAEPDSIVPERVVGNVQGFTSVKLERDRGTDDMIAVLGTGYNEFDWGLDGNQDDGSGGTGDVILTTAGNTAGDSYTIIIDYRLKG